MTEPIVLEAERMESKVESVVVVTTVDEDEAPERGKPSSLALESKARLPKRYDRRTNKVKGPKTGVVDPGLSSSTPHPVGGGGGGGGEPPASHPWARAPNDLEGAIDS